MTDPRLDVLSPRPLSSLAKGTLKLGGFHVPHFQSRLRPAEPLSTAASAVNICRLACPGIPARPARARDVRLRVDIAQYKFGILTCTLSQLRESLVGSTWKHKPKIYLTTSPSIHSNSPANSHRLCIFSYSRSVAASSNGIRYEFVATGMFPV